MAYMSFIYKILVYVLTNSTSISLNYEEFIRIVQHPSKKYVIAYLYHSNKWMQLKYKTTFFVMHNGHCILKQLQQIMSNFISKS
jgi:hypothetical protein